MTDDLVKRLREYPLRECREAADRIEKLEQEVGVLFAANVRLSSRADLDSDGYVDRIEKLEAALTRIADLTEHWEHDVVSQANEIARKALEGR